MTLVRSHHLEISLRRFSECRNNRPFKIKKIGKFIINIEWNIKFLLSIFISNYIYKDISNITMIIIKTKILKMIGYIIIL